MLMLLFAFIAAAIFRWCWLLLMPLLISFFIFFFTCHADCWYAFAWCWCFSLISWCHADFRRWCFSCSFFAFFDWLLPLFFFSPRFSPFSPSRVQRYCWYMRVTTLMFSSDAFLMFTPPAAAFRCWYASFRHALLRHAIRCRLLMPLLLIALMLFFLFAALLPLLMLLLRWCCHRWWWTAAPLRTPRFRWCRYAAAPCAFALIFAFRFLDCFLSDAFADASPLLIMPYAITTAPLILSLLLVSPLSFAAAMHLPSWPYAIFSASLPRSRDIAVPRVVVPPMSPLRYAAFACWCCCHADICRRHWCWLMLASFFAIIGAADCRLRYFFSPLDSPFRYAIWLAFISFYFNYGTPPLLIRHGMRYCWLLPLSHASAIDDMRFFFSVYFVFFFSLFHYFRRHTLIFLYAFIDALLTLLFHWFYALFRRRRHALDAPPFCWCYHFRFRQLRPLIIFAFAFAAFRHADFLRFRFRYYTRRHADFRCWCCWRFFRHTLMIAFDAMPMIRFHYYAMMPFSLLPLMPPLRHFFDFYADFCCYFFFIISLRYQLPRFRLPITLLISMLFACWYCLFSLFYAFRFRFIFIAFRYAMPFSILLIDYWCMLFADYFFLYFDYAFFSLLCRHFDFLSFADFALFTLLIHHYAYWFAAARAFAIIFIFWLSLFFFIFTPYAIDIFISLISSSSCFSPLLPLPFSPLLLIRFFFAWLMSIDAAIISLPPCHFRFRWLIRFRFLSLLRCHYASRYRWFFAFDAFSAFDYAFSFFIFIAFLTPLLFSLLIFIARCFFIAILFSCRYFSFALRCLLILMLRRYAVYYAHYAFADAYFRFRRFYFRRFRAFFADALFFAAAYAAAFITLRYMPHYCFLCRFDVFRFHFRLLFISSPIDYFFMPPCCFHFAFHYRYFHTFILLYDFFIAAFDIDTPLASLLLCIKMRFFDDAICCLIFSSSLFRLFRFHYFRYAMPPLIALLLCRHIFFRCHFSSASSFTPIRFFADVFFIFFFSLRHAAAFAFHFLPLPPRYAAGCRFSLALMSPFYLLRRFMIISLIFSLFSFAFMPLIRWFSAAFIIFAFDFSPPPLLIRFIFSLIIADYCCFSFRYVWYFLFDYCHAYFATLLCHAITIFIFAFADYFRHFRFCRQLFSPLWCLLIIDAFLSSRFSLPLSMLILMPYAILLWYVTSRVTDAISLFRFSFRHVTPLLLSFRFHCCCHWCWCWFSPLFADADFLRHFLRPPWLLSLLMLFSCWFSHFAFAIDAAIIAMPCWYIAAAIFIFFDLFRQLSLFAFAFFLIFAITFCFRLFSLCYDMLYLLWYLPPCFDFLFFDIFFAMLLFSCCWFCCWCWFRCHYDFSFD